MRILELFLVLLLAGSNAYVRSPMSESTFSADISSGLFCIIFHAPWQTSSQKMLGLWNSVSQEVFAYDSEITMSSFDCSTYYHLCSALNVKEFPTATCFINGVQLSSVSRVENKEALVLWLDRVKVSARSSKHSLPAKAEGRSGRSMQVEPTELQICLSERSSCELKLAKYTSDSDQLSSQMRVRKELESCESSLAEAREKHRAHVAEMQSKLAEERSHRQKNEALLISQMAQLRVELGDKDTSEQFRLRSVSEEQKKVYEDQIRNLEESSQRLILEAERRSTERQAECYMARETCEKRVDKLEEDLSKAQRENQEQRRMRLLEEKARVETEQRCSEQAQLCAQPKQKCEKLAVSLWQTIADLKQEMRTCKERADTAERAHLEDRDVGDKRREEAFRAHAIELERLQTACSKSRDELLSRLKHLEASCAEEHAVCEKARSGCAECRKKLKSEVEECRAAAVAKTGLATNCIDNLGQCRSAVEKAKAQMAKMRLAVDGCEKSLADCRGDVDAVRKRVDASGAGDAEKCKKGSCDKAKDAKSDLPPIHRPPIQGVKDLDVENFHDFISEDMYTFVDFYNPRCAPCLHFENVLSTVAKDYTSSNEIAISRVNCHEQKQICRSQQIKFTPTVRIFKNSQIIKEHLGEKSYGSVKTFIKEAIDSTSFKK